MTLCFSHCSLRDELQDVRVDLVLLEVDRRDAVLLREEVRDLRGRRCSRASRACSRGSVPDRCCSSCAWRSCARLISFSRTRSSPRRLLDMVLRGAFRPREQTFHWTGQHVKPSYAGRQAATEGRGRAPVGVFDFLRKNSEVRAAKQAELRGDLARAVELYGLAGAPDEAARVMILRGDAETDGRVRLQYYVQAAAMAPEGRATGRGAEEARGAARVAARAGARRVLGRAARAVLRGRGAPRRGRRGRRRRRVSPGRGQGRGGEGARAVGRRRAPRVAPPRASSSRSGRTTSAPSCTPTSRSWSPPVAGAKRWPPPRGGWPSTRTTRPCASARRC